ncbi:porin family protein [Chryseolinea sp. T2]|uniref:porin family protein n=1 Tax=Chryseolinea sp. T2 TaxID=3129255 RepID=UPI0030782709
MRKILTMLMVLFVIAAHAQQESLVRFEQYVQAGFNFGALTPVSLPNNIRRIDSWVPKFCPSIGYEGVYRFNERWGVGLAMKFEYKGMVVKDSVAYLHTIITVNEDGQTTEFEGDFTGTNETHAYNGYLTVPVNAVYDPGGNWRFKLGFYMAFLVDSKFEGTVSDGYIRNGDSLGEKIMISEATFDFKNELRTFDVGLQGGAGYRLSKKLSVEGNLNWGLRPAFPSSFEGIGFNMYNIFLTLGVAYQIR